MGSMPPEASPTTALIRCMGQYLTARGFRDLTPTIDEVRMARLPDPRPDSAHHDHASIDGPGDLEDPDVEAKYVVAGATSAAVTPPAGPPPAGGG